VRLCADSGSLSGHFTPEVAGHPTVSVLLSAPELISIDAAGVLLDLLLKEALALRYIP
jgi:hypothetical protein